MFYPEKAAHMVGWISEVMAIVLFVALLIGGCIRKADDKDDEDVVSGEAEGGNKENGTGMDPLSAD